MATEVVSTGMIGEDGQVIHPAVGRDSKGESYVVRVDQWGRPIADITVGVDLLLTMQEMLIEVRALRELIETVIA